MLDDIDRTLLVGHLERVLSEQVHSIGGIYLTSPVMARSSAQETREIDISVTSSG